MNLRSFTLFLFCSFSFAAFAHSQSTLDLSDNTAENTFRFPGTVLSLDTSGLNLQFGNNMKVLFNETEQTVFAVEQLETSLEEYESVMSKMLILDTIFTEQEAVFKEYRGKLTHGKTNVDGLEKEIWVFYLGNQEHVLRIMALYNSDLQSKYIKSFEKAIKTSYINEEVELSIYEDLPFYLDESKFPYTKQGAMMPQSIILVRDVEGLKRIVTMAYMSFTDEEIEELITNESVNAEIYQIGEKKIIISINTDENTVRFSGFTILDNNIIMMNCKAAVDDEATIEEFREMAKSVEFRRN